MSDTETVNGLVEEVTTYVVQLQAENAKLQASNEVIAEDHAALCEHNAKLRELVKDMLDVMLEYRCDIRMPNSLDYSNEPAVFKERARELGVEVK